MKAKDKATVTPPAAPPTVLTFSELLGHIFASKIRFYFAFMPDASEPKRYAARVNDEEAFSDDAVTAVLAALALGIRKEQERTERHSKSLDTRRERLAEINRRVPGLSAHEPDAEGKCTHCGEVHSTDTAVTEVLTEALSRHFGAPVQVTEIPDPAAAPISPPAKRGKKNPN